MQRFLKSLHRSFCSWQCYHESLHEKLSRLSMEGRLNEAISILRNSSAHGEWFQGNTEIYVSLIRSCIRHKAFAQGREIHRHIKEYEIEPNVILQNNIMMMYSKCGEVELARQVFDEMTARNLFSWTAVIGAYTNSGDTNNAFELYEKMILSGTRADHFLYPIVLKSCAGIKSLRRGQRVHADVMRSRFQWDLVVMNSLIDMYAKCESLRDAKRVFAEMAMRDIFTWTSMIVGYVQTGHDLEALELFKEMMLSGVVPGSATFAGVLPVFSNWGCLDLAKQIHGLVVVFGCDFDRFVGTALVDMYANCMGLGYGRLIFDRMKEKDIVCWNTVIKGYAQVELFDEAIELLKYMQIDGINPNKTTWECIIPQFLQSGMSIRSVLDLISQFGLKQNVVSVALLDQLCECIEDKEPIKELHQLLNSSSDLSGSHVISSLIKMYSKFADVEAAQEIFNSEEAKDLNCWNSMIACYAQNKQTGKALECFNLMQKEGLEPNLLSWNTVIAGLADASDHVAALEIFTEMKWANRKPDSTTFETILPVIGSITSLMTGKQLHNVFLRNELEMSRFACTTFINMYSNCGDLVHAIKLFEYIKEKDLASWNAIISGLARNGFLEEAAKIFNQMKMSGLQGNVITWTALVSGYAQNGKVDESLKHFRELQFEGISPNSTTIASILPACAHSATLSHGKSIHGYILRSGRGYEDLFVTNALMGMYVKCGIVEYAEKVFRRAYRRDVVSWNTMIHGFAIHGQAKTALTMFDRMLEENVTPNGVTFIGVLNACSHAGLIDQGWKQFNCMESKYGIIPSGKHYACMVDLLGRGGHFEDIKDFIIQMPLQPTASLWGAVVSSCKIHGNVEMAEYAANRLIELQPDNPGNYVVLSNIYATAGRWNDVDLVRKMMVERGVRKLPGSSWIETGRSCIHAFTVENLENQEMEEINRVLIDLAAVMREEEYAHDIPDFGDENRMLTASI